MSEIEGLRRRRKAERPTEILEAAFDAFAVNGYAGTRLDDIAERAGITKGTIYLYFGSKEDLFVATLKEMTRPSFENLAALTASPQGSAMEMLRTNLVFTSGRMLADRRKIEVVRILMAEGPKFPNVVDRWYAEVIAPVCTAFESIVTYGIARGEFRTSAVASDLPLLLLAPIIMANNWLILFGDRQKFDIPHYIETTLDVFARGLAVDRD